MFCKPYYCFKNKTNVFGLSLILFTLKGSAGKDLYCYLWTDCTHYSITSISDFEQIYSGWDCTAQRSNNVG